MQLTELLMRWSSVRIAHDPPSTSLVNQEVINQKPSVEDALNSSSAQQNAQIVHMKICALSV